VLERERATAQLSELLWREQQSLLHALHDALGQTLAAVGMLSSGLRERLATLDSAAAETAGQIGQQAHHALEQVRQLSRSVFPIEVTADSFLAALHDLAAAAQSLHKIRVTVDGTTPPSLRDGRTAMQLYRIAQEAVTNALKHARARVVSIKVEGDGGMVRLRISDDGVGMGDAGSSDGMGLRIMRHSAALIGATLAIGPGTPSGTLVTCTLRASPVFVSAQAESTG
jgi:signal transduction histidine kinase